MKRFGQGIEVDRSRPHIFHRDYVALRVLRDAVNDFAARLEKTADGVVLDLGAGDSPYSNLFASKGWRVVRADVDPVDPAVLPIDASGMVPISNGSVGLVLSTQVLEHVPNVAAYLAEALRVLRPGGTLFLTTHGTFILHGHPSDYWRWTINGLRSELSRAGFQVESVEARIGMLATATHQRGIAYGAITRRIPGTGWLRPIIYLFTNLRMLVEERITPASARDALPELLIATARKPA